jgi:predicted ATPase
LAQSLPDLERELPESVRSMIERKIAQLGEEDRRVLVAASVQGSEFEAAVVARALALDAADVEEELERLERVHAFVRLVGEHEFPDRTLTLRYRFVHVLYQNALYGSLRPTRRASLSAAVAQALVGHHGEKSAALAGELALLWEAARDFAQAAQCFLHAAENAARLFANQEAVVLARRGLDLLGALPDSPERARQELALQIALGSPLMATKGFSAPEVETTYKRAHELCRQVGETPDLFPAMWGLWLFHISRSDIPTARNLGAQLLSLGQRAHDPALLLQAHHALGPTHVNMGDWGTARAYLEQSIALYDPQQHRAHAFIYGGHDPCVCCLGFAAQSLWMLGYPDQGLRRSQEALTLASGLSHSPSLAHARFVVGTFHQFRRNVSETQMQAEACQRLSAELGLPTYLAGGSVLRGWALSERGHGEEGLAQIRQGLAASATIPRWWRVQFHALLAETCSRAGKVEEGLAALAEALRVVEETGIGFYEPELHRLQGELMLARSPENPADAEASFRHAIDNARRQSAKSLELRAVLSLSRLYYQQGKKEEAHRMLAEIYGWFTEGFDTADLQEAKAMLQVIS